MKDHEQTTRPVLFFTKSSEFPYWGKGSSIFLVSVGNLYWLTARHVMENQSASAHDLMITPTDESSISVPFNELIQLDQGSEKEDYKDLYMLRINQDEFFESTDTCLYAWDIDRDFYDCSELSVGDELFMFGFPSESRFVDYDVKRIHFTQVVPRGIYEGPSSESHCHKLRFETSLTIEDFDGLSGGPVFRHPHNPEELTQLVGVLIRGTSQSGLAYFIDCAVINEFVHLSNAS